MNLSWNVLKGPLSAGFRTSRPRRPRQATLSLESLEGRVVPAHGGLRAAAFRAAAAQAARTSQVSTTANLAGQALAARGGIRGARAGSLSSGTGASQDTQLTTDLQKLRTNLNAVLAGSGATDAQRLALRTDFRSISEAGFQVNKDGLATVADSVLTALANGADPATDTAIQTAFNAQFTGGTDTSGLIAQAYTDFVAVARALNLDATELSTLAADRTAIAADYTRLGITGRTPTPDLDLILSGVGGHLGGGC
jgi:hypothetical protein